MTDVWQIPAIGRWEKSCGKHPTQKPLALLARIILASTRSNAWILDPFSGSGTTGIAANLLGRKYLGLEIEDSSLAMSKARRIEIEDKSIRQSYIDKLAKMHLTPPQDTLFSDDFEEYGVPWL